LPQYLLIYCCHHAHHAYSLTIKPAGAKNNLLLLTAANAPVEKIYHHLLQQSLLSAKQKIKITVTF